MILFGYIDGVFRSQSGLEESLQAVLTEESAVELLAGDLGRGSVADFSLLPSYRIDQQTTSFQVTGIRSTPPEELVWRVPGDSVLSVVPLDESIVVLSGSDGDISVDLLTLSDPDRVIHLADMRQMEGASLSAAALRWEEDLYVFAVFLFDRRTELVTVFPDGGLGHRELDVTFDRDGLMVSAGFEERRPALILSDGSPMGLLVYADDPLVETAVSPPCAVPVFFDNGGYFRGSLEDGGTDSGQRVIDVISGDFTADGNDDLVFAGRESISIFDSGSGGLVSDSIPGGSLAAWGTAEGRGLLSARWIVNGSQVRWRVYLDGRFMDSPGPEFMPLDWEGRITYSRHSMLGTLADSMVYARENTGDLVALSSAGSSMICDIDGIGPDVIGYRGSIVEAHLNPLEGNGLHLTLRSVTRGGDGGTLLEGFWDLIIFGSGQDKRVSWERSA
jgi:hypothetical protein